MVADDLLAAVDGVPGLFTAMTNAELRDLYVRIAKIRREAGKREDYHEICVFIAECGCLPYRRVYKACEEVDA